MEYQVGDIVEIKTLRYSKGVIRRRVAGTEYYYVSILEDGREVGLTYILHTSEIDKINY